MSNDLISRSALLQKMQENKELLKEIFGIDAEYARMSVDSVIEKIKSIPAAYDVDKVVEQIRQIPENYSYNDVGSMIDDAIEFVKSGGIE